MASNLNVVNGRVAMAYVGSDGLPWHKLGTSVEGAMTSAEALDKAGLDYKVVKRVVQFAESDGTMRNVDGRFVNVREDTEQALGIVGSRYEILQNHDAFKFFDSIVGEKLAMYHTAGALGFGERIWMLAKLPTDMWITPEDKVEKYLLLTNSHDGSKAVEVCVTPIRVVCQNTLNMAIGSTTERYRSRHTISLGGNIKDIRNSLGLLDNHFRLFEDLSKKLVNVQANKAVVAKLFDDLGLSDEKCKESTRSENVKYDILKYFETGKGNRLNGVKGSAWALLNGVAEYVDYERGTRGETEGQRASNKINSIIYGSGAKMKQKTLDSLVRSTGLI